MRRGRAHGQVANATVAQKMLADGIFHSLNEAFDRFKEQNGMA